MFYCCFTNESCPGHPRLEVIVEVVVQLLDVFEGAFTPSVPQRRQPFVDVGCHDVDPSLCYCFVELSFVGRESSVVS